VVLSEEGEEEEDAELLKMIWISCDRWKNAAS